MPVRIRPLSDLHFTHHNGGASGFFDSFLQPDPGSYDVTVVAGDIDNPAMGSIEHVARNFTAGGKRVVYVRGNHCDYRGLQGRMWEFTFIEEQRALLAEFCAQNGIDLLDRSSIVIHIDGVDYRFVGCTGWPEFAPELVPQGMSLNDAKSFSSKGWAHDNPFDRTTPHNDFREIRVGKGNNRHNLTPSQMMEWSKLDTAFLHVELSKEFSGESVVITHVGPASLLKPGMMSWLYGSRANEDAICNPSAGVTAWLSGHTHRTFDLDIGGVRCLSNGRGYPGENPDFDPRLIVEVGLDYTPSMRI